MARSKKTVYSVVFILALIVAFYFILLPLLRKKTAFSARVSDLKNEIVVEQESHRRLQRERQMLEEKNPEYLEKSARDNFGLARNGEIVYKLEKEK